MKAPDDVLFTIEKPLSPPLSSPDSDDDQYVQVDITRTAQSPLNLDSISLEVETKKEFEQTQANNSNTTTHTDVEKLNNFDALCALLFLPLQNAEYVRAFKIFENSSQLDELSESYLKVFFDDAVPALPIEKEKLFSLPNLFKQAMTTIEYDLIDTTLRKMASKQILSKSLILEFFEYYLNHPPISIDEMSSEDSRIELTMIYVLLEIYYRETSSKLFGEEMSDFSQKNSKEQEEIQKRIYDRINQVENIIKNYLSDDSVSAEELVADKFKILPAVLFAPIKRLKQFLCNDIRRDLRIEARNLCAHFKIPLDLPKMLSLSVDGIEEGSSSNINENLTLVAGPTGVGKSSLTNRMTGTEFVLVDDGDIRLIPKPGQEIAATVGYGWSSQTLYAQIVRKNALTLIDLAGFKDTHDSDRGICAALGLPLTVDSLKYCTIHLLEESDLKDDLSNHCIPAFIRKENREFDVIINTKDGTKRLSWPKQEEYKTLEELFLSNKVTKKLTLAWSHPTIQALTALGHRNMKVARCVAIVIPYNTFTPNAESGREERIRELSMTLFQLFRDPLQLARQGNLVFVLSKPPTPNRGKPFDTRQLHQNFRDSLTKLRQEKARTFSNIGENEEQLRRLQLNMEMMKKAITELKLLNSKDGFKMESLGWFNSLFFKLGEGKDKLDQVNIALFIENLVKTWKEQHLSQECIELLRPVLRRVLESTQSNSQVPELQRQELHKQVEMLEGQFNKLQKDYKDLKLRTDNDKALKLVLDIIDIKREGANPLNNIFIFRGYEFDTPIKGDQPDDTKRLIEHLNHLANSEAIIPHDQFSFDPTSQEFRRVVDWAREFSNKMNPLLEGLCDLPSKLESLNSDIKRLNDDKQSKTWELKEQFTTYRSPKVGCDLRLMTASEVPPDLLPQHAPSLVLEADGTFTLIINSNNTQRIKTPQGLEDKKLIEFFNVHKEQKKVFLPYTHEIMSWIINQAQHKASFKYIEELKMTISGREQHLKQLKDELNTLTAESLRLKNRFQQIVEAPAVEYGTRRKFDKRAPRPVGDCTWTVWPYNFQQTHNQADPIPIDRVEMSCAVDENGKLIFKTPIGTSEGCHEIADHARVAAHKETKRSEGVIEISSTDDEPTGKLTIEDNNLQNGILKVEYKSNYGKDGHACIRTFVLPKYIPKYQVEISEIRKQLADKKGRMDLLDDESKQEEIKLKYDRTYLNLLESKMRLDQQDTVFRIKTLLHFLEYEKEKFKDEYLPNIQQLSWIENPENFNLLCALRAANEATLKRILGMDLDNRTFTMILMGKLDEETPAPPSEHEVTHLSQSFPRHLFKLLYKFVNDTGLSILSLRELLLWDFKGIEGEPLPRALARYQKERNEHQYIYNVLAREYAKYSKTVDALKKIIGIMNLGFDVVGGFADFYATIQSRKQVDKNWQSEKFSDADLMMIAEILRGNDSNTGKLNYYVDKYKLNIAVIQSLLPSHIQISPIEINTKATIKPIQTGQVKQISTLNTRCMLYTLSRGVFELLKQGKLDPAMCEEIAKTFNFSLNGAVEFNETFLKQIESIGDDARQEQFAKLLWKWSIDYTVNNYSRYQKYYENSLIEAFQQYLNKGTIENALWDFPFIQQRFEVFKTQIEGGNNFGLEAKRKKEAQTVDKHIIFEKLQHDLLFWWNHKIPNTGKMGRKEENTTTPWQLYFEDLKRAHNRSACVNRWEDPVVLDAIACRLKIAILYTNTINRRDEVCGMAYGVIHPIKKEKAHYLEALQIGRAIDDKFYITVKSFATINARLNIIFSKDELKALLDKTSSEEILKFCRDNSAKVKIAGVKDITSFCNRLQSAGVITTAFEGASVRFYFVDRDRLQYLKKKAPKGLLETLKKAHQPEQPSITMMHEEGKWSIKNENIFDLQDSKGAPKRKPKSPILRFSMAPGRIPVLPVGSSGHLKQFFDTLLSAKLIAESTPVTEAHLSEILERAFAAANGGWLNFFGEADLPPLQPFQINHTPGLILKENNEFDLLVNNKSGVQRIPFPDGFPIKTLLELFNLHRNNRRVYFKWSEHIMQWVTLQGGHIQDSSSDFVIVRKLLAAIEQQGSFARLPFKDGRNWLHYLCRVTNGPFVPMIKKLIRRCIDNNISPYDRDNHGNNVFLTVPPGDPIECLPLLQTSVVEFVGLSQQIERIKQFANNVIQNPKGGSHLMLLVGPSGTGKTTLIEYVMKQLDIPTKNFPLGSSEDKWVGQLKARIIDFFKNARELKKPICLIMDEMDGITPKYEGGSVPLGSYDPSAAIRAIQTEINSLHGTQVILIGATNYLERMDPAIVNRATPVNFVLPSKSVRRQIIDESLTKVRLEDPSIIQRLTDATTGWSPRMLSDYLKDVIKGGLAERRIANAEFIKLFEEMRQSFVRLSPIPNFNGIIAPSLKLVSNTDFSNEVVGLDPKVKAELGKICSFLERPDAYLDVLNVNKRLLLYGPPGTGKTLFAKTVANHSNAMFIAASAGKYKLGSFNELRKIFDYARSFERAIVFLDELDAIGQIDSAVREDLQAMLDGFEDKDKSKTNSNILVVIAATNYYERLAPAMLRRFKNNVLVPLPTELNRTELFKFNLKRLKNIAINVGGDLDHFCERLASLTEHFSHDDIQSSIESAAENAIYQGGSDGSNELTADQIYNACNEQRHAVLQRIKVTSALQAPGYMSALSQAAPMLAPATANYPILGPIVGSRQENREQMQGMNKNALENKASAEARDLGLVNRRGLSMISQGALPDMHALHANKPAKRTLYVPPLFEEEDLEMTHVLHTSQQDKKESKSENGGVKTNEGKSPKGNSKKHK